MGAFGAAAVGHGWRATWRLPMLAPSARHGSTGRRGHDRRRTAGRARGGGAVAAGAGTEGGHGRNRRQILGSAPHARPSRMGAAPTAGRAGAGAPNRTPAPSCAVSGRYARAGWAIILRGPRAESRTGPRALRRSNPEGKPLPRAVRTRQAALSLSRGHVHRAANARRQGPRCRSGAQAVGNLAGRTRRRLKLPSIKGASPIYLGSYARAQADLGAVTTRGEGPSRAP